MKNDCGINTHGKCLFLQWGFVPSQQVKNENVLTHTSHILSINICDVRSIILIWQNMSEEYECVSSVDLWLWLNAFQSNVWAGILAPLQSTPILRRMNGNKEINELPPRRRSIERTKFNKSKSQWMSVQKCEGGPDASNQLIKLNYNWSTCTTTNDRCDKMKILDLLKVCCNGFNCMHFVPWSDFNGYFSFTFSIWK